MKILIVNNNMHIGGVQKALLNLLWEIKDAYDVTLLLFYADGTYIKELPPEINVVTPNSGFRYLGMTKYDVHGKKDKLCRTFFGAVGRLLGRKYATWIMGLGQKKLTGYDVAVSYLHNSSDKAFYGGCNEFVLKHVDAKRKVAFLHCDYAQCGADTPENGRMYAQFDTIAACSQGCADSFLQANPGLKGKVKVVTNCHRFEQIQAMADAAPVQLCRERINLLTVARLGKEKGVDRALRTLAKLGSLADKIHYYIIGDGIQRAQLARFIAEENLSETVTLCGMTENPYGYIRAADLLVIPSNSEGAPLVITEAACLGTPILSTRTCSADEMITQNGIGWVCDNSVEGLAEGLRERLMNPSEWVGNYQPDNHYMNNDLALAQFKAVMENSYDIADKSK